MISFVQDKGGNQQVLVSHGDFAADFLVMFKLKLAGRVINSRSAMSGVFGHYSVHEVFQNY